MYTWFYFKSCDQANKYTNHNHPTVWTSKHIYKSQSSNRMNKQTDIQITIIQRYPKWLSTVSLEAWVVLITRNVDVYHSWFALLSPLHLIISIFYEYMGSDYSTRTIVYKPEGLCQLFQTQTDVYSRVLNLSTYEYSVTFKESMPRLLEMIINLPY